MKKQIENYLYDYIPITKAMDVKVVHASVRKIILSAPLANNINHKSTVFGGSLHSVATLACWSLLYLNLKNFNPPCQIVITHSEVDYLAPVNTDFEAQCSIVEDASLNRFFKMLQAKGKARIELSAQIFQNQKLCVNYRGTFAALR